MSKGLRRNVIKAAIIGAGLLVAAASLAENRKYDPGASDTEIRIGQTMPYSGPVSAFSVIGKVEAAYFQMINDRGGIDALYRQALGAIWTGCRRLGPAGTGPSFS
jgi:hypothetical protein